MQVVKASRSGSDWGNKVTRYKRRMSKMQVGFGKCDLKNMYWQCFSPSILQNIYLKSCWLVLCPLIDLRKHHVSHDFTSDFSGVLLPCDEDVVILSPFFFYFILFVLFWQSVSSSQCEQLFQQHSVLTNWHKQFVWGWQNNSKKQNKTVNGVCHIKSLPLQFCLCELVIIVWKLSISRNAGPV